MTDIPVTAGNTANITFQMNDADGDPYSGSLDGAVFRFTCRQRNGSTLTKRTDSGTGLVLDVPTSQVRLSLTVAETRALPLGRVSRYELEYLAADEEITVQRGFLTSSAGNNNDG